MTFSIGISGGHVGIFIATGEQPITNPCLKSPLVMEGMLSDIPPVEAVQESLGLTQVLQVLHELVVMLQLQTLLTVNRISHKRMEGLHRRETQAPTDGRLGNDWSDPLEWLLQMLAEDIATSRKKQGVFFLLRQIIPTLHDLIQIAPQDIPEVCDP